MRKVFYASVLVWLSLFCSVGRAAHVYFNLQNFTTQNVSNKTFKIAPASMPSSSGGAIILREPQTVTTGNGTFYVSNMVAGSYSCTVSTPIVPTTFSISVPDTNTVVYATNLLITTSATTTPDDQFVKKLGSWSYNQILTGAVLRGSSTAFQHTNGAVNGYVLTTDGTNATWAAAPGASGGEANVLGHLGTTNTTDTFSLEGTKSGVSLLMPPLRAGANISLTNQGTNIVIASTGGGSSTGYVFNANQFAADNVTNVSIKAGVQATNVDANNLTNRGVSLLSGQVTANSSVSVGNNIVLDPSDGRVQGKYLNLDIGGGAFGTWHTNYLDLFGGSILNAGGITNNGVLTNQGAVSVKGPATFYGAVSNLSLTGSRLAGTDANDKLISYSAGTGISFGASSVALNEAALPIVSSLFPTNLVRAQDGTGASESITVSNLFNSISPSYLVAAGDSLVAYDTYTANVPVAQRVAYGADWFTKLITRSNYFFEAKSYNLGRAGTRASEWVSTYYNSDVVPLAPPSTNGALLALEVGVNDVVNGGTFAQLTNDIGVLWTRGASNNFAVVAFTVATNSNGTMSAAEDQVRTNFNVWVRTNSQLYYKLVDSDLIMTNSVTGTVDGIHWLPLYNENLAQNFVTNVAPLGLQKFWGKLASPTDLDVKGIKATNAVISALLEVQALIRAGYMQITNNGSPGTKAGMELLFDPGGSGGYIQSYDRDNALWKDTTIGGNVVHLSGQTGLSFDNRGPVASGYFWKATDSIGAGIWANPNSILSGLSANTFVILNDTSTLTTTNGWQVTSNSFQTMWPNQYVFIGDSLTEPQGASGNGQDWPAKLLVKSNFWYHSQSFNLAAGATKASDWVASTYDLKVPPVAPANTNYGWLFIWLGGNDILNSATFQQVTNDVSQLWARGRTNKFKIAAFTISTNSNGTMSVAEDQVRTNFNVWVRTNSVNTDVQGRPLFDYLVDTDLFITNSPGQTVDGIHWKPGETERLALSISTNLPILPPVRFWQRIQPPGPILADTFTATNASYLEGGVRIGGGSTSGTFTHGAGLELTYNLAGNATWSQSYNRGATNWIPYNLVADSFNFWPTVSGVTIQDTGGLPTTNTDTNARLTVQGGKIKAIAPGNWNTNILEIWRGSGLVAGVESNGIIWTSVSNSALKYPASHNLATMSGFGSSTNTTTGTNSLFGAIGQGSLTLPARFTATFTNRVVVADMWGDYWTGATPGTCRFIASLGGAAVNVSTVTITPPFSVVAGRWEAQLKYLFLTNSSTVGSFDMSGRVTFYSGGGIITNAFLPWTRIVNDDTTTNQDIGFWSTNGATTVSFLARGATLSLE